MVISKDVIPLLSVDGLGAGVTSILPTVTLCTETKRLNPSASTISTEPGMPLVWLGLMPGDSTVWVVRLKTSQLLSSRKCALNSFLEGIVTQVGIRT